MVVQIITRVHDSLNVRSSRLVKESLQNKPGIKRKPYRLVERICTALAIQLRKRDSSASRRGTFVSPLKELAAINERSGRKSN